MSEHVSPLTCPTSAAQLRAELDAGAGKVTIDFEIHYRASTHYYTRTLAVRNYLSDCDGWASAVLVFATQAYFLTVILPGPGEPDEISIEDPHVVRAVLSSETELRLSARTYVEQIEDQLRVQAEGLSDDPNESIAPFDGHPQIGHISAAKRRELAKLLDRGHKIKAIVLVRGLTPGLSLREAKDLVEGLIDSC